MGITYRRQKADNAKSFLVTQNRRYKRVQVVPECGPQNSASAILIQNCQYYKLSTHNHNSHLNKLIKLE